ncbi:MAG: PDDEXK nuclease domain-containing protein, partial [Defluviitaleaceae bacterium]|nr:PDDEXK nuclease domain-containing protein [Defluviitaleaceae bacterium]
LHRRVAHWRRMRHQRSIRRCLANNNNAMRTLPKIIEQRKLHAQVKINYEGILMFWEVGKHIGSILLGGERAEYGNRIVVSLAQQLQAKYGGSFDYTNVTRMIKLATRFPNFEILAPLAQQLSWSHFTALLPIKNDEAFMFYASDAVARQLGKRDLRKMISRKAYERQEIANYQLSESSGIPFNAFKDPYLLDVYGLKDNYLEADLEKAILLELEKFILENGRGFTYAGKQVHMNMDGDTHKLDLLFYNRVLKRLVAIDLKIGKFKPEYSGQMRFYLKWLERYEMLEGENPPIGIILCAGGSREKIELMELDKEGIAVAQYWTHLPPKLEFERKITQIYEEAKERLERRKLITKNVQREIDYFYELKEEDADIEDEA